LPSARVEEVMHSPVVAVRPGSKLREAATAMIERRIHRVLVTKGAGELVGVLSTRDVMRAIAQDRIDTPLSEVMTTPVVTIDVGDPLSLGIDMLVRSGMHGVLVVENQMPVGLFTQAEALRSNTMPAMAAVESFMSHAVLMLQKSMPAHRAAGFAIEMKSRRIVAMDGAKIAGIATGIDLLKLVV
jgi:predicted transcriptional regulator